MKRAGSLLLLSTLILLLTQLLFGGAFHPAVAAGDSHKVIAPPGTLDTEQAGVELLHDYGSYALYRVGDSSLGRLPAAAGAQVQVVDEMDRLLIDAYPFNTQRDSLDLPASLRLDAPAGPALQLIQFVGPVTDEWLEQVRKTGALPIHYIANNGYLVWAGEQARDGLASLARDGRALQYSAPYQPFFKLGPGLSAAARATQADATVKVVIQMFDHPGKDASERQIAALALAVHSPWTPILAYQNATLTVRARDLETIARLPDVYWMQEWQERELMDEVQGQILAGNFDGSQAGPSGTGYKAWLDGLGFSQSPADYPIVDVTDDGVGDGTAGSGDTTLYESGLLTNASRLAALANCTNDATAGGVEGHGHINASIIGGYDTRSGAPYQDGAGFQRGLGINPYGRLASTRIFDTMGYDVSACGSTDQGVILQNWNNGARISSNSWGASVNVYDTSSQAYDAGTRDADPGATGNQQLIFVFAAGNDGSGPSTIGSPGNGKNMITVGASENDRPTWVDGCGVPESGADNAMDIINFSSRGPAPGGRVKPEVIAPGTHIQGTASPHSGYTGSTVCDQYQPGNQTVFAASSGTSHATPAVAGVSSLAYWWLEDRFSITPSPAMMKAYLIAHPTYLTGLDANDTLPSNDQGYGMPNMSAMFDDTARYLLDQSHLFGASGETWNGLYGVADTGKPLRIVLAYTDAPGATGTSPQVNNLNLAATVDGVTYYGNHFSGQWSTGGGSADNANNYEAIFLPAGTSGSVEITVTAFNIGGNGVPGNGDSTDQDFALVCYNCSEEPNFSLSVTPAAANVCAPDDAVYNVELAALNGFAEAVTLNTTGAPGSASFATNPLTPPDSTGLTIGGAGAGSYNFDVTGTATGGLVHTDTVSLVVDNGVPAAPLLSSPADGSSDTSVAPTFVWSDTGASDYLLEIAGDSGFGSVVYSATLSSASHTPSTFLAADTTYYWRVTAQNACGGTASTTYSFTTGTGSLGCNGPAVAFENGIPADWQVVDNSGGSGIVWTTTADAACAINNRTNGSGEAACADSDATGNGSPAYDTELVSNPFDLPANATITLEAAAYYRHLGNANHFNVDLWDGSAWTNLLTWAEDHRPGDISLDLSAYAGLSGLQLRFAYAGDGWDWYAQVDDVALSCTGLPVVAVPAPLQSLQAAGQQLTQTMSIGNSGQATLDWTLFEDSTNSLPTPGRLAERRPAQTTRTDTTPAGRITAPAADVVADGSFEAGTPNPYWNEASSNFGTPLCDANCGTPVPHSGAWYAWFGGIVSADETGSLSQDVTIPPGTGTLSFWLSMGADPGASGSLAVSLDGDSLFGVTAADAGDYTAYTPVVLDVSAYADGGSHTLLVAATTFAGPTLNFFVDDIVLDTVPAACTTPDDVAWLSASPGSGSTAPGSQSLVDVVFDATGLADGTYTADLCLSSNDPVTPLAAVPVTMTVDTCAATPAVAPLLAGSIQNTSDLALSWAVDGANYGYEMHGSPLPYAGPDGSTWLADYGSGETAHTAAGVIGDGSASYYLLLGENCNGSLTAPSNRVGEFEFGLVPGS